MSEIHNGYPQHVNTADRGGQKTPRVPFVVVAALLWVVAVDIPTRVGIGPVSLSAAATVAVAGALLLLSLTIRGIKTTNTLRVATESGREQLLSTRTPLPVTLKLFLVLAAVSFVIAPSPEGLQNTAVYVMFASAIAVTAANSSLGTSDWILRKFRLVAILVGALTITQALLGTEVYGERSVGLLLVPLVAVTLVAPRKNRFEQILPYLLIGACALTLSRTAMLVAVLMVPLSIVFTAKRAVAIRVLAVTIPVAYVAWTLVTSWAPLRDRFLEGDGAYSVGGLNLNTSGRAVLWDMTVSSWQSAALFGHGPGSASALISERFNRISHPHNEYLRMLHDFGLIGASLFTIGLLSLIWITARKARTLPQPIHKAAALSLIGVAVVSFTDNAIVYPFLMLPVAVLVGASMAYPLKRTGSADVNRGAGHFARLPLAKPV